MPRDGRELVRQALGKSIKRARVAHGLTQEELGLMAGLAGITVYLYETGRRAPDYETLMRIARACATTVSRIVMVLDDLDLPPLPELKNDDPPMRKRKWR